MTSTARRFGDVVEYDEAEVRRRLGRVYYLLLHGGGETQTEEAQAAVEQGVQPDAERLV